ncbi:C39 family peptidase [Paenibacillus sp. HN-1]|uniref:C39 family peptidase n=1 Tax=Paenibacillus TaxID=44249 RepID=UPI001CA88CD2|nr:MULTISPECIES: C39 family peptidase [Paenibacillus]MBY9080107.1 C39 family peptidase [Paenibacillus sp. CGMCC 1.18879]MBY9086805.1 C39 family peptidase [Paenibacillus sinensis]
MTAFHSRRLAVEPYTQWAPGVQSASSACGPATMAAIAEYWGRRLGVSGRIGLEHFGSKVNQMNHLYRKYGGRPWGMSATALARGMKAFLRSSLGQSRAIEIRRLSDFEQYKAEIDADRPVAVKFDKWLSFRWRGNYDFDYHWTVGIGYELTEQGPMLLVQDNGLRCGDGVFDPSRERRISYTRNADVLSMVALRIE